MNENEFINAIKKVSKPRIHKVKNSYGVYDGYKFYRKNKPKESKYMLTESQYFAIIRKVNVLLGDRLTNGGDVILPCRMGRLEMRKHEPSLKIEGNALKTNLPIDWNTTLKLWYEDKEAFMDRTLVRQNVREVFRLYYNRSKANFNNKSFYRFELNRELKKRLKANIKEGKLDAFTL